MIRNTTLRHLSRHFSDKASSWLSVPGNPLIKWPTQPHHLINPPPTSSSSLQQQNPNPTSNDDVERDCATISDLLKDHTITSPTHLESALNNTGIKPTPPLLQTLFTKFDSSPTPLFTLFQWAHKQQPSSTAPLLNPMIDLLGKFRNFDTAWSLLLLHHPSHTTLDTFAVLIRRYARAGSHLPKMFLSPDRRMPDFPTRTVESCQLALELIVEYLAGGIIGSLKDEQDGTREVENGGQNKRFSSFQKS